MLSAIHRTDRTASVVTVDYPCPSRVFTFGGIRMTGDESHRSYETGPKFDLFLRFWMHTGWHAVQ